MDNINRSHLYSQISAETLSAEIKKIKNKIIHRGDLPYATVSRQIELLKEFASFPLGQFILVNKGADGYWTDFLINYPNIQPENFSHKYSNNTECFFLNHSPIVTSTRERFNIFQKLTQSLLKDNCTLASIPCGVMRDLLTLDFSRIKNFTFYGVDIDPKSLDLTRELANQQKLSEKVKLYCQDAWNLDFKDQFDIINSNGLNVYEKDRTKVISLYKNFHKALKRGGSLICGILTYPPWQKDTPTGWSLDLIPDETVITDRIIHKDILDIGWQSFRSLDELATDFIDAGFSDISIHYDSLKVFPTILAKK